MSLKMNSRLFRNNVIFDGLEIVLIPESNINLLSEFEKFFDTPHDIEYNIK